MNKNNSQLSRPKRIISLIIVILPIINQYKFGYLTFLELFSLVISFYYICQYRKIRFYTFNSFFYIYLLYSVLFGLLSVLRFNEFSFFIIVSRYVKLIIIYFTFITVIPKLINLNYFVKLYKRISLILTSLVFFQSSIFNLLKKPIYLLIPNTLLNYNGVIKSNELINHNIFLSLNGYLFRPSSVFIEPSHYSLYILPCLVLCLFYKVKEDNTNINFKLTIFLTIGALLTTSMLSILGVILIWLFFFVSSWKKNIRINA